MIHRSHVSGLSIRPGHPTQTSPCVLREIGKLLASGLPQQGPTLPTIDTGSLLRVIVESAPNLPGESGRIENNTGDHEESGRRSTESKATPEISKHHVHRALRPKEISVITRNRQPQEFRDPGSGETPWPARAGSIVWIKSDRAAARSRNLAGGTIQSLGSLFRIAVYFPPSRANRWRISVTSPTVK